MGTNYFSLPTPSNKYPAYVQGHVLSCKASFHVFRKAHDSTTCSCYLKDVYIQKGILDYVIIWRSFSDSVGSGGRAQLTKGLADHEIPYWGDLTYKCRLKPVCPNQTYTICV